MPEFETSPFEEQLDRIREALRGDVDPWPLLAQAASLPDAEPFARLLFGLADDGRLEDEAGGELGDLLARLSDAALLHVYSRPEATLGPSEALLSELADGALRAWPLERIQALAFLSRWLRHRAPSLHERLRADAEQLAESALNSDGGAYGGPPLPAWLLLLDGGRLHQLAADPRSETLVADALRRSVGALANCPKTISQANAEALLARRVYAEAGHFFFELLQNADDAGASRWEAQVRDDRVVVSHDGEPFSFGDLVGVLSIGQTTKRVEQIGFFGVGFKSVYEISSRPRVHSGAFDFEIAHVSIPRIVARPPTEGADDATTLVLPLDPGEDPVAIHRRTREIPPETILTLPNLRAFALGGPDGQRIEWSEEVIEGGAVLRRDAGAETRRYRCIRRQYQHEGEREEGRPARSPVLVAVAVEEDGSPRPIEGPSLFAFLPTREDTGLRVLIHARFDVTVDRERLEHDSTWNTALLRCAGEALAEAALSLVDAGQEALPILPSPEECSARVAPLCDALRDALRERPCLRGADGARLAPSEAARVDPTLVSSLAGLDLGGGRRALARLAPREEVVALSLGASTFGGAELVAYAREELRAGKPSPHWLGPDVLRALAAAEVSDGELRALPLLLDGADRSCSAEEARLGSLALSELYAGLRPIVAADSHAALPDALRSRIALESFDASALWTDLADPSVGGALVEREALLLRVLDELPDAQLEALAGAPIWRIRDGSRVAISGGLFRLAPALSTLGAALPESLPLLAEEVEADHPELTRHWIPLFGLEELVHELSRGLSLASKATERLLTIIDLEGPSLPRSLCRRIAALPIFTDRHGARRGLFGEERALISDDAALPTTLPEWPWLAEPGRVFVELAGAEQVGADEMAAALCGDEGHPPLSADALPRVFAWLAERAEDLSSARVARLGAARMWLDRGGEARDLDELRDAGGPDLVARFYDATQARAVAHPASLALARSLGLAHRIAASDLLAVLRDLRARRGDMALPRELLGALLEEAAASLPSSELEEMVSLPIFVDEDGERRRLGSWGSTDEAAAHRAGPFRDALRAGHAPLLSAEDETLFAAFLSAVGPEPATVVDVLVRASSDAALLREPDEILRALDELEPRLDESARQALAELPLFASEEGTRHRASELCLRAPLVEAWGEADVDASALSARILNDRDGALLVRLGLPTLPVADLLREAVLPRLVAERPLASQPPPFTSPPSLVALAALTHGSGLDALAYPLALDARGLLVQAPLADGSQAVRALTSALGLEERMADAAWADQLPPDLRARMLVPLPARLVAASLARACPEEAPRRGHYVLGELEPLFHWLREFGPEIAADEAAKGALGAAAVLPSQRGTLRAPTEMVLDASFGDVGLDWGLADDIPADVAAWLGDVFELGRKQRRAVVDHVLDGLDAAATADDAARAAELIRFLAAALGARDASPEELEERARRLDVRARLRVPLSTGAWEKPRRALLTAPGGASELEFLAGPVPASVALPGLDETARRLLRACGARADLAEDRVARCLEGADLREGAASRLALARYVLSRARSRAELRSRWRLDERRWVPDAADGVRRPAELLYPDALAEALFETHEARFPDPEVVLDISSDEASRFGFARARDLSLAEMAAMLDERPASAALLDWLEEGLRSGRLVAADVRSTFRDNLLLVDDEGTPRPARELTRRGSRELFGPFRGDYTAATQTPKLVKALGVPDRPNVEMILAFLTEIGALEEALTGEDQRALSALLPECLQRLGEAVEGGAELRLPADAPLAGSRAGETTLTRTDAPSLRLLEPPAMADALPPAALEDLVDPLPNWDRGPGVRSLLHAAGVADLWSDFAVHDVLPGPSVEPRQAEAESLHRDLARVLRDAVGRDVRLVDSLAVSGDISFAGQDTGRSATRAQVTAEVDAIVHAGVLWITPPVLADPERLAPALAAEPTRRVAFARWLRAKEWESLPKRLGMPEDTTSSPEASGFFSSLRRMLGGTERGTKPEREQSPRPKRTSAGKASRDDRFFRPESQLQQQFRGGEGWTESRHARPDYGFAFRPSTLPTPWLYAPKLVATEFERRGQYWKRGTLKRPEVLEPAGEVVLRGRLPRGDAALPIPLYARLDEVHVDGVEARTIVGATGETILRLGAETDVRLKLTLGRVTRPERLAAATLPEALTSFVPDDELPDEVLSFVDELAAELPAFERAAAVVDFIRRRYRYDPSYLEDDGLGNWMARVTRGRAQAHVAALHLGADGDLLGRGVCFELNTLACELLRRAGVPSAIATGWVFDGGFLSEPDHLWAIALLQDPGGAPAWVPVDASTTERGRPLRVPQRPPGKFKAPRLAPKKIPTAPSWGGTVGRRAQSGAGGSKTKKAKKRRAPRGELLRVIRHLERTTGRTLSTDERATLQRALEDPREAQRLLRRLLD